MSTKKHEHDEHQEAVKHDRQPEYHEHAEQKPAHGLPDHGLVEPADDIHKEFREQDRIREQQQIEAQTPVSTQAGVTPSGNPFPFSASLNEPQTVSLPVPENVVVPVPSISSILPNECAIGDDDFTLDVSGENFFPDSVIWFAGHAEPTTYNEEEKTLSTGVKPSLWTEPAVVKCQVKNGPEVSNEVDFTFTDVAAKAKRKR
jgi:hypothetical protein